MLHKLIKNKKKYNIESPFQNVRELLDQNAHLPLLTLLQDMHIADIADVIEDLNPTEREKFIIYAGSFIDAELLFNLKESFRQQVLDQLGFQHFKGSISQLSNEDIFTLIETFDEHTQDQFLNFLPIKRKKIIKLFLTYPESSVGRYMSVDFITLSPHNSVQEALNIAKLKPDLPENFSEFIIVDNFYHPIGIVFLKDLFSASLDSPLSEYMITDIMPIHYSIEKEEASSLFSKYKNICSPVISDNKEVVGILRSDDILEIVFEEVSAGILNVGGMPLHNTPSSFWKGCFVRLRWIAVTVINASFSPLVIDCFQDVIQNVISLAVLMPLVASIGGVVGIQTVSVMIKEFAEGSRTKKFLKSILRESAMGFINGIVIGALLGTAAAFFFHNVKLGSVLFIAMFFSMTWAAFIGAALPVISSKLGFDSTLSSGPIVTTITDVSGFAFFLSLAKIFL